MPGYNLSFLCINQSARVLMKKHPIIASFILIMLLSWCSILNSQSTAMDDARIDIESDISKITWDEDIIRSWDASGAVTVNYLKSGKSFYSKSDSAIFSREGDAKPFKDTITLKGNIACNLNGMQITADDLQLISSGDTYRITSAENIKVDSGTYSIETDSFNFDAINGVGTFTNGANLTFTIDNPDSSTLDNAPMGSEENVFGQCLRINTDGGTLKASEMMIQYEKDTDNLFRPVFAKMPSGGELLPLVSDPANTTAFQFGYIDFDLVKSIMNASNNVRLTNGPCQIEAETVYIDWPNRNLTMKVNVILSRELFKFQCGELDISWDEVGRISLTAKNKPSMTITIPEETVKEAIP
jgi:lipopolysaccharide export system protein LptA